MNEEEEKRNKNK